MLPVKWRMQHEAEGLAAGRSKLLPAQRAVLRFHERHPWFGRLHVGMWLLWAGANMMAVHLLYEQRPRPAIGFLMTGVVLSFATLGPLWWKNRTLRRLLEEEKRSPSALCPECGYNTHGIDSSRCPECGSLLENEGRA